MVKGKVDQISRFFFKYSFLLVISWVILFGLISNPILAVNSEEVPLYGLYETTIDYGTLAGQPHSYTDPFYGVEVEATFSRPSGGQITWWGFYDGDGVGGQAGNIWKIRFMPDELGTWSYTWKFSDGSLSGSGSFQAVDNISNPRKLGPLQHDPNIHQWFITADKSKHIFPNMYNKWQAESNEAYINPQVSISEVKNHGFDVVVLWSTMYQKSATLNSSNPIIWNDTESYVPRLRGWSLMENGIYKEAYDNSIYIYEWDGFYSGNDLYKLHKKSISFQNKVIKYWLLRTAPYYIFLYNIGFELPEYTDVPAWPVVRAEFVKSIDPWDHLITGHELHSWSYSNESVMDFSALQNDNNFHQRALDVWNSPSKPHPHCSECIWNAPWQTAGTEASHRKDLWDGMTGGMSNFLWTMDNDTGLTSFKYANSFLKRDVQWWLMSPNDEVVTEGTAYVLANSGVEYIAYSSSGSNFSLNIPAGNYQQQWFNPANGTYQSWISLNTTVGAVTFNKPNSNDWVLHIRESADSTTSLPTNGLVGYWKLDEGNNSNAEDSSGNDNNGTLINSPTWTTGQFGQALKFDGIDDYVEINDHNSLKPANITVSVWVNITNEMNWDGIVSKMDTDLWDKGYCIALDNQTPKNFMWFINNESTTTLIPTTSGWIYLVGTYDGSVLKFYKNGILEDTLNDTDGIIHHAQPVMIGNVAGAGYYLDGMIDNVRIYNRALSAVEVQVLYNESKQDKTPPTSPIGFTFSIE